MDLRVLASIAKRWLPLLIASAVLAAAAGFSVSNLQPKVFEAKATLIVGQSLSGLGQDYTQLLASQRLSTTYASVATHRPRLAAVISELGLDVTPQELGKRVVAEAPIDSTLVTITAQAQDADEAAAIANAMAGELISASPAIQGQDPELQASLEADLRSTQEQVADTRAQIDELASNSERTVEEEARLAELQARLATLRATYATLLSFLSQSASSLLTISEPAVPPTDTVSPRPLLNTLLAVVLGLVIAVGIVVLAEYFRDSMDNPEEIQAATGLSTLGTIARMKGGSDHSEIYQLAPLLYPRSATTEAYRTLATNIEFSSVDAPLRTLLVASALPGEGKTVTASNLAIVFAQAGQRVLLVDADLRKPGVHRMFGLPNSFGLTTLFRRDDPHPDTVVHATQEQNLKVLTAGPLPPNPREMLGSQRMRELLAAMVAGYDVVVIDSPPVKAVSDATVLSSILDGCVFVIDASRSRRRPTREALQLLDRAGAHMLGAVLNRVSMGPQESYSSYYSGVPSTAAGTAGPASNSARDAGSAS